MPTKKKTSAAPAQTTDPRRRNGDNMQRVQSQAVVDGHWLHFPPGARKFIMENPNENVLRGVPALVDFWSSPRNFPYTRGHRARCLSRAAWCLALFYLKLGLCKESRALIMHGSFIHQCHVSSIEYVSSPSECGVDIPWHILHFRRGVDSLSSAKEMESFILSHLAPEDAQCMTTHALDDQRNPMDYIDKIAEDWKATSSASKRGHPRSSPNDNETRIELILVEDSDRDNRYTFDVGSSTTLKALFNEYADKRGISLRSLRFSYTGKTLFLSNAGRKTPEDLGFRDKDVIVVHNATRSYSNDDDGPSQRSATSKKSKAKEKSTNKKTMPKQKSKKHQQRGKSSKTLEEDKVEHSKKLTKIHGEAHDQFRRIRQRLNNLVIERSQPKLKSKFPRSPKDVSPLPSAVNNAFNGGLGKKAGKSRYAIQVGEVKNLHKTTKQSAVASSRNRLSNDASLMLDLHGCTREEALARLDSALEAWVDVAMRGPYPFVLPATIVCGCGSQILSETVQEWIRSNNRVSNAPKVKARPWK